MAKATITEVGARIAVKASRTDGVQSYDSDNAYPQRVENTINSSGTGKLVTKMLARFIFGGGFTNKDFYKSIVNRKRLTADKLLRKQSNDASKFGGIAFHFNYNLNFKKSEVNPIPFKHIRFTTEDNKGHENMFAVYDDWGREKRAKIDKDKIAFIDFYNPDPEVIQQQVDKAGGWKNYKGQILYWTPEGDEYPLAPCDAVLEDLMTDAEVKVFKLRNIKTNFMASHIIEVDQFAETDENTSAQDEREAFMETLQSFQGGDDGLKIMLLERRGPESGAKITKFDIQDVDKLYAYTEDSVRDNIIRQYLIPPVLLMAIPGKLGSSSEINQATQFYNAMTNDYRIVMEELFKEAFSNFYYDINPSQDYTIIPVTEQMREPIPTEFFPDTSSNERRASIGLAANETPQLNIKSLSEIIGVGGTTALIATITDAVLSKEQKIETLLLLFPITRAQATAAVTGIAPTT